MMIKINLLPVRQVKKREASKQILVLYAVLLVGAFVGNFLWYDARESVAQDGATRIQRTDAKIKELQKVIGEVDNINARKVDLEAKLKVLKELKKGRSGPVRILDALAESTPKKVWLKDFDEKSGQVKLTGTAMTHEDVAELMRNLQSIVWTPKGMGRLVEHKRNDKTMRIELLTDDAAIEEFNMAEVGSFFTGVELKSATQKEEKSDIGSSIRTVEFQMSMAANYTL